MKNYIFTKRHGFISWLLIIGTLTTLHLSISGNSRRIPFKTIEVDAESASIHSATTRFQTDALISAKGARTESSNQNQSRVFHPRGQATTLPPEKFDVLAAIVRQLSLTGSASVSYSTSR
jgi:hypothetical protein